MSVYGECILGGGGESTSSSDDDDELDRLRLLDLDRERDFVLVTLKFEGESQLTSDFG